MQVFGDSARTETLGDLKRDLNHRLEGFAELAAGLHRHSALVAALIAAGELAQGAADCPDGAYVGWSDEASRLTLDLARAVQKSWASDFRSFGVQPAPLASRDQAGSPVTIKQPEGFAYYAVYPEAYLAAAAAASLPQPVLVLGLRSIGTSLGACVAAATGSPYATTTRPSGHPFERRVTFSAAQIEVIVSRPEAHWAVVDEGPGLSGSSLIGAADALLAAGTPMPQIHLFTGHAHPPGQHASQHGRERWQQLDRHAASFDDLLLHSGRLARWASTLLGPAVAPLQDISGGCWRTDKSYPTRAEAPVHPHWERRKFLFFGAQTWKLKFVGLGRAGATQLDGARALDAAGFGPPVAGMRHGFLVERWLQGAAIPLSPRERASFVDHLGRYLAFRSGLPPPGSGASIRELFTMAQRNLGLALGLPASAWLETFRSVLDDLQRQQHRVWTDNRLHAWEWLQLPDGRFIKTDATDHAAAHDLIGSQDIAWDVVGAAVEFNLSRAEQARICAAIAETSGRLVDPLALAFYQACYLAFQIGSWTMAASACANAEDRCRAEAAVQRYRMQFTTRCLNG